MVFWSRRRRQRMIQPAGRDAAERQVVILRDRPDDVARPRAAVVQLAVDRQVGDHGVALRGLAPLGLEDARERRARAAQDRVADAVGHDRHAAAAQDGRRLCGHRSQRRNCPSCPSWRLVPVLILGAWALPRHISHRPRRAGDTSPIVMAGPRAEHPRLRRYGSEAWILGTRPRMTVFLVEGARADDYGRVPKMAAFLSAA